jgi:hypothetical protein
MRHMSNIKGVRVYTPSQPDGVLHANANNFSVSNDGHLYVSSSSSHIAVYAPNQWISAKVEFAD